jgi:hypothetical protein
MLPGRITGILLAAGEGKGVDTFAPRSSASALQRLGPACLGTTLVKCPEWDADECRYAAQNLRVAGCVPDEAVDRARSATVDQWVWTLRLGNRGVWRVTNSRQSPGSRGARLRKAVSATG